MRRIALGACLALLIVITLPMIAGTLAGDRYSSKELSDVFLAILGVTSLGSLLPPARRPAERWRKTPHGS